MAAAIAYRLTSQVLPKYSHANGHHHFELPQLAACVVMKFYLGLSYRAMEKWLLATGHVCQVIGLPNVPDHTTLHKTHKLLHAFDFEKMKNQMLEGVQVQEEVIASSHTGSSPGPVNLPDQTRSRGMNEDSLAKPLDWKNHKQLLKNRAKPSTTGNSSWSSRLIVIWLAGMVVFLPIKILNLPLNFELVDIWTLGGIPGALYLYSLRRPRVISLSYLIPMWFVLISSFISAFASPSPVRSMIVILKEVYLFVWFFVVLALLFQLSARHMREVLRVWSLVVICHGLLMLAQFISPDVWEFTNSLGGNSARLEGYRAAGLFICDKAGCANKAAFFQLLGFVPLLLAGYSKRTTIILGIFLFASMMTSGSMGATLAFSSGLMVAVFSIAYFKKSLSIVIKNFLRIGLALCIFGGALYIAGTQSPDTLNHFKRIIVGRFDRSSEGRFDLWGRGIDVLLEHNAFLWGVGPENFREVDASGNDNQLHNDTLAFLVERGLLGLIGLALFAGITLTKAVQILRISGKDPRRARWGVVVFLAALAATMVESLTHQIFHTRELWLVLAVQEAVLYKMITSEEGMEPTVHTTPEPLRVQPRLLAPPGVAIDG